jgi:hypothetical protein
MPFPTAGYDGLVKRGAGAFVCLLLMVVAGDCGSGSKIVPRGHWGGMTVDLDVTDTGGAVAFCCGGRATIDQPMVLDADRRFDVTGVESFGQRMHYYGSVSGDTMTLRVETVPQGLNQWFPIPGPEGTDNHFVLHAGVAGTYYHPDGTGACICGNPMDPPGHQPGH